MQFPIQPVPISQGPKVQVQPPPFADPAGIIMQAAQMRQQRDLAEQQMSQRAIENTVTAFQTAQSLQERKREALANEQMAQMTHAMASKKLDPEMALMQAHANYFNQQAKMFENAQPVASALLDEANAGHVTMEQLNGLAGRNPALRMALANEAAARGTSGQGIDFRGISAQQAGQVQGAKLPFTPAIQMRMRNYSAALPQLETLHSMSQSIPDGQFQDMNAIMNQLETKSGSRIANAMKTQISRVLLTLRAASPNGTDAVLDQDIQQLNLSKSKEQLQDSIKILFKDAVNQRNTLDPTNPGRAFMTDEEKGYGLYPSAQGFGGLGNISSQDKSPGGGLMDYFNTLLGGNGGGGQTAAKGSGASVDTIAGARAERLKRNANGPQ